MKPAPTQKISYAYALLQPRNNVMSTIPACPQCGSEYAYADGEMYICPEWLRMGEKRGGCAYSR